MNEQGHLSGLPGGGFAGRLGLAADASHVYAAPVERSGLR